MKEMKLIIISFLLIIGIDKLVQASNDESERSIKCETIKKFMWSKVGSISTCKASSSLEINSFETEIAYIVDSKGYSLGKSSKIQGLWIKNAKVNFIPGNIKNFCPLLRALSVENSGLLTLDKEDMRQFGSDLIQISFFDNSIRALKGDLFEFNNNLKYVDFSSNPIEFIDAHIFDNFGVDIEMKLFNTICISDKFQIVSSEDLGDQKLQWISKMRKCNKEDILIEDLLIRMRATDRFKSMATRLEERMSSSHAEQMNAELERQRASFESYKTLMTNKYQLEMEMNEELTRKSKTLEQRLTQKSDDYELCSEEKSELNSQLAVLQDNEMSLEEDLLESQELYQNCTSKMELLKNHYEGLHRDCSSNLQTAEANLDESLKEILDLKKQVVTFKKVKDDLDKAFNSIKN